MSNPTNLEQRIPSIGMPQRLYLARDMVGLTQQQLAELMGVSRRTVVYAETGEKAPRRPTVAAWSLATGVPMVWLETGETPAGDNPDGGGVVRHQGLEPRTRWFGALGHLRAA